MTTYRNTAWVAGTSLTHLDISMAPLLRATLTQLEYGFRVNPHLGYPSRLWREKKSFPGFSG
jgi:hypothetical protein